MLGVVAVAGWRGGMEGLALPAGLAGMEGPALPEGGRAAEGLAAGTVVLVEALEGDVVEGVPCPLPEGVAASLWPLLDTGAEGLRGEGAPLPEGAAVVGSARGCSVGVGADVLPEAQGNTACRPNIRTFIASKEFNGC